MNESDLVYDLVIVNGRVMDPESGLDALRSVGVVDGKIVAVTEGSIEGKETIDAKGHVVAPGFIDTHCHGCLDPFSVKVLLRDGVTTPMDLECGVRDVDQFYRERDGEWQANYGTTVGHAFARMHVLDGPEVVSKANDIIDMMSDAIPAAKKTGEKWVHQVSSYDEIEKILAFLDNGLKRGGLGIGVLLGYTTKGTSAEELYRVQGLGGSYGRLSSVHTRYASNTPPHETVIGVQEVLANAMILDAPLIVCHLNSIQQWEMNGRLIEGAQKRGAKVWGEVYPYEAACGFIGADVLAEEQLEELGISYSSIELLDGTPFNKEMYDDYRWNKPGEVVIIYLNDPEEVAKWLALPGITVGADGIHYTNKEGKRLPRDAPYEGCFGHPRGAGAHAKVLRLVRETNNMPLMEAIEKLSFNSAKYLWEFGGVEQMKTKGRIQVGADADITVFDPETVTDTATYKPGEMGLPSTGIPYVIVNGATVVKDSEVQNIYAGKPVRFSV